MLFIFHYDDDERDGGKQCNVRGRGPTVGRVKLPSLLGPTHPPSATGWHFVLRFTQNPHTSLHFVRIRRRAQRLLPTMHVFLSWLNINHCGYHSDSAIPSNAAGDSKRTFLLYTLPWNNIFARKFDAARTQCSIERSQAQGCQSSALHTRCIRRAGMQECN